jgi:hypothetical protein
LVFENVVALLQDERKGVGGELIDWDLEQARAPEGKVSLEASEKGIGFYSKKGLKVVWKGGRQGSWGGSGDRLHVMDSWRDGGIDQ